MTRSAIVITLTYEDHVRLAVAAVIIVAAFYGARWLIRRARR